MTANIQSFCVLPEHIVLLSVLTPFHQAGRRIPDFDGMNVIVLGEVREVKKEVEPSPAEHTILPLIHLGVMRNLSENSNEYSQHYDLVQAINNDVPKLLPGLYEKAGDGPWVFVENKE